MKTLVTFRELNGEVIALMPEEIWSGEYIASYLHVGQHGGASKDLLTDLCKPTPDKIKPLYEELKAIGYDMEVI